MNNILLFIPLISSGVTILVACLIFSKNIKSFHNTLLFFCFLLVSSGEFCVFKSINSALPGNTIFWARSSVIPLAFYPALWYLFAVTFARNEYKQEIQRHGILITLFFLMGLFFAASAFSNDFIISISDVRIIHLGYLGKIFILFLLALVVIILFILENTFHNIKDGEKWKKIRLVVLGMSLEAVCAAIFLSYSLLYNAVSIDFLYINSTVIILSTFCIIFAFIRYTIYGTNIFISRYVFYKSSVIAIVGIFLFVLGAFGEIERYAGEGLGVLFSLTLSVLLTSFLAFIFFSESFRIRYNTISCLSGWPELLPVVVSNIADTLHAKEVMLWVVKETDNEFWLGASVGKTPAFNELLLPEDVLKSMHNTSKTIGLSDNNLFATLKKLDAKLLVPMKIKERLIGFLTIGESSLGEKYVDADFELLETVSLQTAHAMWNIKLSEDLAASEEKEKLDKIVSFIVHDLKNCATLLNMVVQNARNYSDNLEFYKDAMETVFSTAGKINSLIAKISEIRAPAISNMAPLEINALLEGAIKELRTFSDDKVKIIKNMGHSLPLVKGNGEQIYKVITNLVLNAVDAVGCKDLGNICVSTFSLDDYVVFEVKDNGCGMSEKFIYYSLFRAFETTKEKGMGIGLYQCKHIVDEHNGKIEVKSKVGEGSSFSVLLPKA